MRTMQTPTLEGFPLRTYTPLQLSGFYEVSKKTFLKWLKPFETEIGPRQGHFYSINQVETIIKKLGIPGKFITD